MKHQHACPFFHFPFLPPSSIFYVLELAYFDLKVVGRNWAGLGWDGVYESLVESLFPVRWVGSMALVGVNMCVDVVVSLYDFIDRSFVILRDL